MGGTGEQRPVSRRDPPTWTVPAFSGCLPALLAGRLCHRHWCRLKVRGPRFTGRDPTPTVMVSEMGPREATRSAGCSLPEGTSNLGTGCGESRPLHQVRAQVVWEAGRHPQRHLG